MARKSKGRPLKDRILVFVEGLTEKYYFDQLQQDYNISSAIALRIDVLDGKAGDFVDKAVKIYDGKYANDNVVKKVIVFDANHKDKHTLVNLVRKAQGLRFEVAFSNVAFEVWLVGHFEVMTPSMQSEESLNRKMAKLLGDRDYKKANPNQIARILRKYPDVLDNTRKINKLSFDSQSTTVGKVIQSIMDV